MVRNVGVRFHSGAHVGHLPDTQGMGGAVIVQFRVCEADPKDQRYRGKNIHSDRWTAITDFLDASIFTLTDHLLWYSIGLDCLVNMLGYCLVGRNFELPKIDMSQKEAPLRYSQWSIHKQKFIHTPRTTEWLPALHKQSRLWADRLSRFRSPSDRNPRVSQGLGCR